MEELFSTREVCRKTDVSKHTACKWARGRVRRVGKDFLWTHEDIEAFKQRNRRVGRPPKKERG